MNNENTNKNADRKEFRERIKKLSGDFKRQANAKNEADLLTDEELDEMVRALFNKHNKDSQ